MSKPEDTAPPDDIKRKFREALEKKNAQNRAGDAHLDGEGKIHGTHEAPAARQEFRRKSG